MSIKRKIQKRVLQLPAGLQSVISFPLNQLALHAQTKHLNRAVEEVTNFINKHSSPKQNRIFIDGGCNNGTTLRAFIDALPPDFRFFGFEVQENLVSKLQSVRRDYPSRKIKIRHAALSDHDGEIEYFPSKKLPWGGLYDRIATTTERGRNLQTHLDYEIRAVAPAINFSSLLADIFEKYTACGNIPFIAIKLNVEGAEYPILTQVIRDGHISQIGFLTAEFHHAEFNGKPDGGRFREQHDQIMASLRRQRIPVHDWTLRNFK